MCTRYYSITDKEIIKSIYNLKYKPGKSFFWNSIDYNTQTTDSISNTKEEQIYKKFRENPSLVVSWTQNFL